MHIFLLISFRKCRVCIWPTLHKNDAIHITGSTQQLATAHCRGINTGPKAIRTDIRRCAVSFLQLCQCIDRQTNMPQDTA